MSNSSIGTINWQGQEIDYKAYHQGSGQNFDFHGLWCNGKDCSLTAKEDVYELVFEDMWAHRGDHR